MLCLLITVLHDALVVAFLNSKPAKMVVYLPPHKIFKSRYAFIDRQQYLFQFEVNTHLQNASQEVHWLWRCKLSNFFFLFRFYRLEELIIGQVQLCDYWGGIVCLSRDQLSLKCTN